MDNAALLLEGSEQRLFTDAVVLQFIAKILVGYLKTLAMAAAGADRMTQRRTSRRSKATITTLQP